MHAGLAVAHADLDVERPQVHGHELERRHRFAVARHHHEPVRQRIRPTGIVHGRRQARSGGRRHVRDRAWRPDRPWRSSSCPPSACPPLGGLASWPSMRGGERGQRDSARPPASVAIRVASGRGAPDAGRRDVHGVMLLGHPPGAPARREAHADAAPSAVGTAALLRDALRAGFARRRPAARTRSGGTIMSSHSERMSSSLARSRRFRAALRDQLIRLGGVSASPGCRATAWPLSSRIFSRSAGETALVWRPARRGRGRRGELARRLLLILDHQQLRQRLRRQRVGERRFSNGATAPASRFWKSDGALAGRRRGRGVVRRRGRAGRPASRSIRSWRSSWSTSRLFARCRAGPIRRFRVGRAGLRRGALRFASDPPASARPARVAQPRARN